MAQIKSYDQEKEKIINALFKYYYLNPNKLEAETKENICNRIKAITKNNQRFYNKSIKNLNRENTIDYINKEIINVIFNEQIIEAKSGQEKKTYKR